MLRRLRLSLNLRLHFTSTRIEKQVLKQLGFLRKHGICGELSQSRCESHIRWAATCTIGSSRYKNLKLKKRKEEKRAEWVEELHISSLRVACKANPYL
jgi:hypothetical protein